MKSGTSATDIGYGASLQLEVSANRKRSTVERGSRNIEALDKILHRDVHHVEDRRRIDAEPYHDSGERCEHEYLAG